MKKPNLFIIGAMKSGTSSLHNHLDVHPQIAMSAVKEPSYFTDASLSSDSVEAYTALFDQSVGAQYCGESSTNYTKLPLYAGVTGRIHAYNPDARLIYIMRDPVDRVNSHYRHALRKGEVGNEIFGTVRSYPYFADCGNYALQLRPYLSCISRTLCIN